MKFYIYEIEHPGDVQHAVDELRRYGATNVQVLHEDFEAEEMIVSIDATKEVWDKIETDADICL